MNTVSNLIKQRRLELGMTQQELADKLGYANKTSIQKLESNREVPIKKLKVVAEVLGIDVETLIKGRIEPLDVEELLKKAAGDPTTIELIKEFLPLTEDKKKAILNYIKNMLDA